VPVTLNTIAFASGICLFGLTALSAEFTIGEGELMAAMSLWDALRMNMMISYQELVRTFLRKVRISGSFLPKLTR
jgi:hypothetical protein